MKFEDWVYCYGISFCHRNRISDDDVMGCYHCCDTFLAVEIEEWINEKRFGQTGETASCPHCGVDAVVRIEDMLNELCERQFGRKPE